MVVLFAVDALVIVRKNTICNNQSNLDNRNDYEDYVQLGLIIFGTLNHAFESYTRDEVSQGECPEHKEDRKQVNAVERNPQSLVEQDIIDCGICRSKGGKKSLIGKLDVIKLQTIVEVLIQNVGYVCNHDQHKHLSDATSLPNRYCVDQKSGTCQAN